jgi:hypothetical protein
MKFLLFDAILGGGERERCAPAAGIFKILRISGKI